MAVTTNYSWVTPDDTALVKDGAAAIRTLGSSVDTTTKALNPSTTLGDIEYRSSTANTNTRLAIGSTGNVLTVSGGVPAWAAPAAGGGMTLISETVASAVSSIDFSSISGSYKQLYIVWSGIKLNTAVESYYNFRFNSNSGGVYAIMSSRNSGTATSTNRDLSSDSGVYVQATSAASTATEEMGAGWMLIDNYASTTKFKQFQSNFGFFNGSANQVYVLNGTFKSTDAITSLNIVRTGGTATISNDTNTTIRLYGIN
jgi:hypothetical protein